MQYVELALPLAICDLLCLIIPAVNFELTWCATFNLLIWGSAPPPPPPSGQSSFSQNRKGFSAQNRFGNAWVPRGVSGWAVPPVTFFDYLLTSDSRLLPICCHRWLQQLNSVERSPPWEAITFSRILQQLIMKSKLTFVSVGKYAVFWYGSIFFFWYF
jgi:hypothetical protein